MQVSRPKPASGTRTVSNTPPMNGGGQKRAITDLIDLAQIPLAGLAARDQAKHPSDPDSSEIYVSPYALDLATVEAHKDPIANAIIELAKNYPVLAAFLNRLASTTPFGALIALVITFGMQIAENHNALPEPARTLPGIISKEELTEQIAKDARDFQRAYTEKVKRENIPEPTETMSVRNAPGN